MKKGVFITVEGNDGAGKTTICKAVTQRLMDLSYAVLYTREPGGSKIAEAIRAILLDVDNTDMDPRTEALLYAASRRQHLMEIVLPALEQKRIVLCDRFIDSSLAYQGIARDIGEAEIWNINQFAIDGHMPEKTIFLSVSTETGQRRMKVRKDQDRLDREARAFHESVREGYQQLCDKYPERIRIIDAEADIDTVVKKTLDEVLEVVKKYE